MITQSYGWNLQRLQHSRNNNRMVRVSGNFLQLVLAMRVLLPAESPARTETSVIPVTSADQTNTENSNVFERFLYTLYSFPTKSPANNEARYVIMLLLPVKHTTVCTLFTVHPTDEM